MPLLDVPAAVPRGLALLLLCEERLPRFRRNWTYGVAVSFCLGGAGSVLTARAPEWLARHAHNSQRRRLALALAARLAASRALARSNRRSRLCLSRSASSQVPTREKRSGQRESSTMAKPTDNRTTHASSTHPLSVPRELRCQGLPPAEVAFCIASGFERRSALAPRLFVKP